MASAQYGRLEYWEEKYLDVKDLFDWYHQWSEVKDIITQYVFPKHKILHAGCGNSSLPFEMQSEGYTQIVNMDNSKNLIESMRMNYKDNTMQWDHKDVRKMDYPDNMFDSVIDKGLLDSILCGDRSRIMAKRMLDQVHRVLSSGGFYISVSHAAPELRNYLFEPAKWAVKCYKVSKPRISTMQAEEDGMHYVYVCAKR